jgi:hypothetical protein
MPSETIPSAELLITRMNGLGNASLMMSCFCAVIFVRLAETSPLKGSLISLQPLFLLPFCVSINALDLTDLVC